MPSILKRDTPSCHSDMWHDDSSEDGRTRRRQQTRADVEERAIDDVFRCTPAASTISSERKIFDFSPKHAAKRMSRLPSTLADASESTTATRTCGGRQQTHTPHIICHVSGISVSRCSNANKPCNGGVVLRAIIRHSIYTNSGGGGGVH